VSRVHRHDKPPRHRGSGPARGAHLDGYEVLDAIAMLVADVTCCVSIADRHQMLRYLIRGIKLYDGESRSRKDNPDSRSLN
jgi:hypothetical protein